MNQNLKSCQLGVESHDGRFIIALDWDLSLDKCDYKSCRRPCKDFYELSTTQTESLIPNLLLVPSGVLV